LPVPPPERAARAPPCSGWLAGDAGLTQVVELRYFGGLTETEIAQALGVTERTVRRDWQKGQLLLRAALE
jgi:hypothetical protein